MKNLSVFIISFLASHSINAADFYPYASIAAGYKIDEAEYNFDYNLSGYGMREYSPDFGGKDTAILEAGFDTNYNISFGLKHDSQWSTGIPFNDKDEYHKTEIFIRYKIGGRP